MSAQEPSPQVVVPPQDTAVEEGLSAELLISNLLRSGVVVSLAFIAAGLVVSFLNHPEYLRSSEPLQRLTGAEPGLHTLSDVLQGVLSVHGQAMVMVGLLVLIATPVMRVALSLLVFRQQGDRTYTRITFVVLVLLMVAFALGRASE